MEKQEIMRMLEYSALAYENEQPENSGEKLVFIDDKQKDIQFYMRFQGDTILIVFRGSDSLCDAVTDMRFWKKTIPYGNSRSKIRVHTGFLDAYKSSNVRGTIHKAITPKIKKIRVAGHSLGAALAVLCAVDLQYNYPEKDFEVVLFGCPRVGNRAFKSSYNRRVFKTVRVENGGDIVTKVPFAVLGYRHVGAKLHVGTHKLFSFTDHHLIKYYSSLWEKAIWG